MDTNHAHLWSPGNCSLVSRNGRCITWIFKSDVVNTHFFFFGVNSLLSLFMVEDANIYVWPPLTVLSIAQVSYIYYLLVLITQVKLHFSHKKGNMFAKALWLSTRSKSSCFALETLSDAACCLLCTLQLSLHKGHPHAVS